MRLAPLVIGLGLASTAYADDRTLHLAVRGSIDSAAVAAGLAKELGSDIELAPDACALPCVNVFIDAHGDATVVFSPRHGEPRQRTVSLGDDTRQWPLVVTLLAGNVVRDEAQDVLSSIPTDLPGPSEQAALDAPAPPEVELVAPPPPPPVAPPPPPVALRNVEHRWLGLGFVPGLSTDLTRVGSIEHSLSIDVLVGVSGGSSGASISGIADIERGPVSGAQIGGILTVARDVSGTQVAGIAAVSGDVDGVQVAGTAAFAGKVEGLQAAGIAAVSRGRADHQAAGIAAFAAGSSRLQLAGIASASGGSSDVQLAGITAVAGRGAHVQGAGIAAVAGGDTAFQAAGITSVASGTANVQLAGIVNVAGRVEGLQLAPINIAHRGAGTQIGVINVGGSPDGFSLGLINIVPGGRYDLEASFDSSQIGTMLFRHGGRRWHNVYAVGGKLTDESVPVSGADKTGKADKNDDVWMYGFGFGPTMRVGDTVIDLEAIGWQVNHGPSHNTDVSLLAQLRLSVAHHWGRFAVVAGGAVNTYITDDEKSPFMLERRTTPVDPMDRSTRVTLWPSAFVGVRI